MSIVYVYNCIFLLQVAKFMRKKAKINPHVNVSHKLTSSI